MSDIFRWLNAGVVLALSLRRDNDAHDAWINFSEEEIADIFRAILVTLANVQPTDSMRKTALKSWAAGREDAYLIDGARAYIHAAAAEMVSNHETDSQH